MLACLGTSSNPNHSAPHTIYFQALSLISVCLCVQILGPAYQAPKDIIIAGQQIPKDFWLVPAKFYELVQTSQRGYELLTEQIELNVNALVRMDVAFEPVKARQKVVSVPIPARGSARLRAQAKPTPPPTTAPKRKQMHFLGEPQNNEILASLAQVRL